jgi:hypothetical protein
VQAAQASRAGIALGCKYRSSSAAKFYGGAIDGPAELQPSSEPEGRRVGGAAPSKPPRRAGLEVEEKPLTNSIDVALLKQGP